MRLESTSNYTKIKRAASNGSGPFPYHRTLILVIVARDLFEQVVGVVVVEFGVVQIVAAWLRIVVQHISPAARATALSAKFAFCPRE